ncbi:MAG: YHS domain-containing protein [Phycisphaerae bacterium]|nr:YHS domain-containing protein [Phycisphaerae bacterium]
MKRTISLMALSGRLSLLCGCATVAHPPVVSASPGEPVRGKFLVNVDKNGVALQGGHDPVAFFTEHKPVKGDPKYQTAYKGAIYYFASAENKAEFERNPAKYEPQFGGFCGYAASIDKISPISVEFFEIINGRLVLQHNKKAWELWQKDVPGNLVKAERNWPGLVKRNGL